MKNPINPKKLLNSKWTAMQPENKQKHFMITAVEFDDEQNVVSCIIQALMDKHEAAIDWRDLRDKKKWGQGWK
jgi:tryptophan-rich hypothetical protein